VQTKQFNTQELHPFDEFTKKLLVHEVQKFEVVTQVWQLLPQGCAWGLLVPSS
jgi:hypothetical protein